MGKNWFLWISLFFVSGILAQETQNPYKSKKIIATKDTISLEKVSINKAFFKVLDKDGNPIKNTFFNLQVQSMSEVDDFWLDSGIFSLNINNS